MASGIYTTRDFQIAEKMAWHKLTRLEKPKMEHFPEIIPMELSFDNGKPMSFGSKRYVVPVATDDLEPVAPPYCSGTYTLFTPREAWAWVTDILAGTEFNVQSIGMLWNRSFWFISTELTELKSLSIGDGRQTNFQLNFSGGLDRKTSPQCEVSSIVAVCHNTISLSRMTGKILFKERATSNFSDKLEQAKSEVATAVGMAAVFKAAMDSLALQPCTKDRARNIFAGYITPASENRMTLRTKNTVDTLTDMHTTAIANTGATEFDLLNAYTEYQTRGNPSTRVSEGRRFVSSEYGVNADSKADFASLLTNDRNRLSKVENRGAVLLAI